MVNQKAKLFVETPHEGGGDKNCINGPGHMTKVAVIPIIILKFVLFRTRSVTISNFGMEHQGHKVYKAYTN